MSSPRMRYFIEVTEQEAQEIEDNEYAAVALGASGPSPMPGNRKSYAWMLFKTPALKEIERGEE